MAASEGTVAEQIDRVFDPAITLADLEWLRGHWQGTLVVKGIQSVSDAQRVVDAGADGVVLSSHGGRQLDRAPVPVELVPAVRERLDGRAEILVDSGMTTGADIVAALALGADAALVGRAFLYGLMASGWRGSLVPWRSCRGRSSRPWHCSGSTTSPNYARSTSRSASPDHWARAPGRVRGTGRG